MFSPMFTTSCETDTLLDLLHVWNGAEKRYGVSGWSNTWKGVWSGTPKSWHASDKSGLLSLNALPNTPKQKAGNGNIYILKNLSNAMYCDVWGHMTSSLQVEMACYFWMEKETEYLNIHIHVLSLSKSKRNKITTVFDSKQTKANKILVNLMDSVETPANYNCSLSKVLKDSFYFAKTLNRNTATGADRMEKLNIGQNVNIDPGCHSWDGCWAEPDSRIFFFFKAQTQLCCFFFCCWLSSFLFSSPPKAQLPCGKY